MTALRTKVHTTDNLWLPPFSLDVKEIKVTVTKINAEVEEIKVEVEEIKVDTEGIKVNTEDIFAAITGRSSQKRTIWTLSAC